MKKSYICTKQQQVIKLSDIKANPNNPRVVRDERFEKLCKSIQEFPKMMSLRPIVVDANNVVLGGNMRLRALQHLKFKDIPDEWVKSADDLTEDEQKRFIIADNVGFGDWDWSTLANEWEAEELEDWGLDVPGFDEVDYSGKNQEIDTESMSENMTIKLEYTEADYHTVKDQLAKIAATPEQAVWKLLNNE